MKKRALEVLKDADRVCGSCTACCTHMEVDGRSSRAAGFELKAAGTRCERLAAEESEGKGCTVYDKRPTPCRIWSCVWKQGVPILERSQRPDQVGVMFAATQVAGITVLYAYDTTGKGFGEMAQLLLEKLADKHVVALVGTSETYGPDGKVEAVKQAVLLQTGT